MSSPSGQPQPGEITPSSDASLARMRALLDRPLPREEIEANTELVAARAESRAVRMKSVLVFAVGGELLALEADDTHRVIPVAPIRRVPHRTNAVFLGLANVAGELAPVASIGSALGVAAGAASTHFVVIGSARTRWAFGVERLGGVRRVDEQRVVSAPTTVRHARDGCTKYLAPIVTDGREELIAVLDADKLGALLARSLA